jgi:hypothetical protein
MLGTVTVVLVVVLAGLVVFFLQTRRKDQISAMLEKRRASSKLVSKAEYASGMARMPVALALSGETVFYENPDMEASLDLARIEEVEYDDELTTGHQVPAGSRVLRLRSHGTAFDFVLTSADASRWQQVLPSRQIGGPAARVG